MILQNPRLHWPLLLLHHLTFIKFNLDNSINQRKIIRLVNWSYHKFKILNLNAAWESFHVPRIWLHRSFPFPLKFWMDPSPPSAQQFASLSTSLRKHRPSGRNSFNLLPFCCISEHSYYVSSPFQWKTCPLSAYHWSVLQIPSLLVASALRIPSLYSRSCILALQ